jgi:hypothetical protein
MYRDAVEQATRNDITAAAAAHRELGEDYDSAIAEGLVDRIGAEIDKRIDARLRSPRTNSRPPAEFSPAESSSAESSPAGRTQAMWIGAGVGAGITGIVAIIANNANTGTNSGAVVSAVIILWVILAVAGLGTAVVRGYRRR